MPPIDAPPMSPQVQAQMGPPGGPSFGPGIGAAQGQIGKSDVSVAVSTVEKILLGVNNDLFQDFAKKAIAILKVGEARANQAGPQSQSGDQGIEGPPAAGDGAPAPKAPLPPMPGQLPG